MSGTDRGAHDPGPDWDPAGSDVQADQRAAFDAIRERCPVARAEPGHWTVFRHAGVLRVIEDHETFSNVVSQHPSVPNGMDPPEHTAYRRVVAPYFSPGRVAAFEPACRTIAAARIDAALAGAASPVVEVMRAIALPFAADVQCAYFGWPLELSEQLVAWVRRNHEATLARDRQAAARIATEFDTLVGDLLASRSAGGPEPPRDATEALLRERVDGRPLTATEIASVLRNSTMGEVGTIAAAIGIVAHGIAARPALQDLLRRDATALPAAVDELLRLHGPLVSNRRVATRSTTLGGREIARGDRVVVNWVAANRDPRAFPEADALRLDRDQSSNLLYGAGIHVCPGATLARMELRVVVERLLAATTSIAIVPDEPARPAVPPAGGFSAVALTLVPAAARSVR